MYEVQSRHDKDDAWKTTDRVHYLETALSFMGKQAEANPTHEHRVIQARFIEIVAMAPLNDTFDQAFEESINV